jgi:aryl-alcohol dehydrogenase-like predicted oxidoreductase
LPQARQRGLGVIAREVLANGLLVKDIGEVNLDGYCTSPEQKELRQKQLADLRGRAEAERVAIPNLALSYVGGIEGVSVSLLGARTLAQFQSLVRHLPAQLARAS